MSSGLNYFTRTMAAGVRADVQGSARFLTIYSLTPGATVNFGFGDDTLQVLAGPLTIDFGAQQQNARFTRVVFQNAGGGAATVAGYFSNVKIEGAFSDLTTLVAIQALLTTIDADTGNLVTLNKIPDTPTTIVQNPVQRTGVGTDAISPAAAAKRRISLQAPVGNAGEVYLGYADPTTAANCFHVLASGDVWGENLACAVFASSENGSEIIRGYSLAIS